MKLQAAFPTFYFSYRAASKTTRTESKQDCSRMIKEVVMQKALPE